MLRLRLLGAPSIFDAAQEIYLPSQKAQALLFYLAAEMGRSFARGQIVALLWEESAEREGRNSLSTVLTRLRQALPVFPIRTEGDTLAWQPSTDAWVDLHEFQAVARTPGALHAEPGPPAEQRIRALENAVALYRGSFLDGFTVRDSEGYEEWLRVERERWQQRWLNAIERLVESYAELGRWDRGIEHARRAIEADPLQERFHCALMRLHYAAGDRAAALAQFRICRDVLGRELGVDPDAETIALHQAILDGSLERAAPAPPRAIIVHADPPPAQAAPLSMLPAQNRLADRLAAARRRSFVGRAAELRLFAESLAQFEPSFVVLHIYGPGGVGKSTLLGEFARIASDAGVAAIALDARNIQPAPEGMINALREATGADEPIAALPGRHVLLIDTYELLAPIDTWLRDHFLPQLPDQAIVVLAGRNPLSAGWRIDPGWQEITRTIQLDNLSEADAAEYLARRAIPSEQRAAVLRFTRGYPLALSLAAEVLLQRPSSPFEEVAAPNIVRVLLERFVAGVPSLAHRAALEACSQARVTTEPLLAAMLDTADARELFEWLRDLSFISTGPRGIFPHDLARETLATDLKWRNPPWHTELHRRARTFYMAEFARTQGQAQDTVLLDLIFLHDNPLIHSIFTWNEIGGIIEDSPRTTDWPALTEIVRRHEGDEAAAIAATWFERQPEGVTVFRDGSGAITGFSCRVILRPHERDFADTDPCLRAVWRYLDQQPPLADGQFVALLRFWMDSDFYQGISPTQGMIFVATTRYILTSPGLAYSFHVFADADLWQPATEQALIWRFPAADFTVGERRYGMFMHDWRAQPPQAWLEAMAEHEVDG